ncbi:alanine racemase [Patescibacteria group bacterium]|nr:alanine racemase [Patescibacteria group bacterium]MBU1034465.1 alanine racemase [Patescibacteria group bacterium]MBU1629973.1 alanine racemase [Patescibacteria group bacterium]MBU1907686.1 alanine racemase [Patescibacteria group bacterium]
MPPEPKTWIEVSKKALKQNIRAIRSHIRLKTEFMAVVKSNAYGHGLEETAQAVSKSVDWFGVDNVDEGLVLRKQGITQPILVLGYTRQSRLEDCIRNKLSFVVSAMETAQALRDPRLIRLCARYGGARVHLKIETGTMRQGTEGSELLRLANALKKTPGVVIEGCSTHYANIEDTTDHSYAETQLARFKKSVEALKKGGIVPRWKHTACSAATLLFPETHFDLVRVGISLYGHWSSKETLAVAKHNKRTPDLHPALTWKTIVAQVKRVVKGAAIGYGCVERVARPSKIAVLPVGYWDGYDRSLSGAGIVLIRGQRCKIVGRVCMNMCMADVTDVPGISVEDEVVLIGRQKQERVTAEEIAAICGTIQYEILTRINPLIPRIVV